MAGRIEVKIYLYRMIAELTTWYSSSDLLLSNLTVTSLSSKRVTTYTVVVEIPPDKLIEILLERGSLEEAKKYAAEFYPTGRIIKAEKDDSYTLVLPDDKPLSN